VRSVYRWGAGLAVTGEIRDIGQDVLQPSFAQEAAAVQSYCHILLIVALLGVVIGNVTIVLEVNYKT
jgi:hypothetical protein